MFFDLNMPIDPPKSKNAKGTAAIESRIDLAVHLGYSVLAFTQTIYKKFDAKTHVNTLDSLIPQLRPRTGILYLKRLNIILDQDSEKGFGLTNANTTHFSSYDILSLTPTNATTFSLACLTHTVPSPLTTHIISLPLTLPRFNFHLKHTLVRTALKNGAVFEITYAGSLGGQHEAVLVDAGVAETGPSAKRNWWANAREIVRVTKGKGIVVGSGAVKEADLRAPRDVQNLITLLGIPQDFAHHALTTTPKSIILRAQTRRTYRAVLSEPKAVIPDGSMDILHSLISTSQDQSTGVDEAADTHVESKRTREDDDGETTSKTLGQEKGLETSQGQGEGQPKKKKRKKNNRPLESSIVGVGQ
ncbi:hypothetical protein APHAL10511_008168 [Amanita phalloides]|nr:hypothetical protein APHAL10511_008168 [Amanita phalloides]